MLRWLSGVLALSCLALLLAQRWQRPEWSLLIQGLSCLAAFGAIPYALRRRAPG